VLGLGKETNMFVSMRKMITVKGKEFTRGISALSMDKSSSAPGTKHT